MPRTNKPSVQRRASARYNATPEGRRKRRFRDAVAAALRRGDLTRPIYCESCEWFGPLDAHHPSYEPGDELWGQWLCKSCHEAAHHAPGGAPFRPWHQAPPEET
jgi:hypothetical protein